MQTVPQHECELPGGKALAEMEYPRDHDRGGQAVSSEVARRVADAIEALIALDAEHLETLLSAAEKYRSVVAADFTRAERVHLGREMGRFAAVLHETRRNLMLLTRWHREPVASDGLGYGYTARAEKIAWVD